MILVIEFRALTAGDADPRSRRRCRSAARLLLLLLTGTELNVSSAMGLILLVGLVVKNGIMMLDYAQQLHAEGRAVRRRGRARRRASACGRS